MFPIGSCVWALGLQLMELMEPPQRKWVTGARVEALLMSHAHCSYSAAWLQIYCDLPASCFCNHDFAAVMEWPPQTISQNKPFYFSMALCQLFAHSNEKSNWCNMRLTHRGSGWCLENTIWQKRLPSLSSYHGHHCSKLCPPSTYYSQRRVFLSSLLRKGNQKSQVGSPAQGHKARKEEVKHRQSAHRFQGSTKRTMSCFYRSISTLVVPNVTLLKWCLIFPAVPYACIKHL